MDLQEKLEAAIRETLHDKEGAGSDLSFIDDIGPGDEWLYVEGNLDVQHLASHVIDVLGIECEYAVQFTMKDGSDLPIDSWGPKGSAEKRVEYREKMFPDRVYTMKIVKRRKAGEVEDV